MHIHSLCLDIEDNMIICDHRLFALLSTTKGKKKGQHVVCLQESITYSTNGLLQIHSMVCFFFTILRLHVFVIIVYSLSCQLRKAKQKGQHAVCLQESITYNMNGLL